MALGVRLTKKSQNILWFEVESICADVSECSGFKGGNLGMKDADNKR